MSARARHMTPQRRLSLVTRAVRSVRDAADALLSLGDDEKSKDLLVAVVCAQRALEAEEEALCAQVLGPSHRVTA